MHQKTVRFSSRQLQVACVLLPLLCPFLVLSPELSGNRTFIPTDVFALIKPWSGNDGDVRVQNNFVSDALIEHYPWKVETQSSFQRGDLPLWNPFNFLGLPLLAGSTSGVTDPLALLLLVFPLPLALHWMAAFSCAIAGVGMYWLLCEADIDRRAAAVGALAYQFNGQFVINLLFGMMPGPFAWLPVALAFWLRWHRERRRLWAALSTLALGLAVLSTHIQVVVSALVAWAMFTTAWSFSFPQAERRRQQKSGFVIGAVGLMIGSFHLVPTSELLWHSFGSRNVNLVDWTAHTLDRLLLIPLIPIFGAVHLVWAPQILDPLKLVGTSSDSFNAFVGFIPILLSAIGLFHGKGHLRSAGGALALGALLLVVLTPVGAILYFRFLVVCAMGLAMLAGLGLDRCLRALATGRSDRSVVAFQRASKFSTIALVLGIVGSAALLRVFEESLKPRLSSAVHDRLPRLAGRFAGTPEFYVERIGTTWDYYATPGPSLLATIAVATALTWLLHSTAPTWLLATGLVLLTLIDVSYFFRLYVPSVPIRDRPLYVTTPAIEYLQRDRSFFRVLTLRNDREDPPILPLESNLPFELQQLYGWGSLPLANTMQLLRAVELRDPDRESNLPLSDIARRGADMLNVKYFLTVPGRKLELPDVDLVYANEIWIYRNNRVFPRAYFASSIEFVDSAQSATLALASELRDRSSRATYLVEPEQSMRTQAVLSEGGVAQITSYSRESMAVRTSSQDAAVLVISDAHYPGWRAIVDGNPRELLLANGALRAISLDPGDHHVEIRYEPSSVTIGLALSVVAALSVIAWAAIQRKGVVTEDR